MPTEQVIMQARKKQGLFSRLRTYSRNTPRIVTQGGSNVQRQILEKLQGISLGSDTVKIAVAWLQSPVTAGLTAYLVVEGIQAVFNWQNQTKIAKQNETQPPPPPGALNFLTQLSNELESTGGILGQFMKVFAISPKDFATGTEFNTITGVLSNVDFTALKAAIIVYIMTGGNLAGLLTSLPNVAGFIATLGGAAGGA